MPSCFFISMIEVRKQECSNLGVLTLIIFKYFWSFRLFSRFSRNLEHVFQKNGWNIFFAFASLIALIFLSHQGEQVGRSNLRMFSFIYSWLLPSVSQDFRQIKLSLKETVRVAFVVSWLVIFLSLWSKSASRSAET